MKADPARHAALIDAAALVELQAIEQQRQTLHARTAFVLGTLDLIEYRREVKTDDNATHQARGLRHDHGYGADAETLGRIEWDTETGEVLHLLVNPDWRRQGIATRLWRAAQALGAVHSAWRTTDGQKWATSLGDPLPPWQLA